MEYYWFDDSDYTACGTYATEAEARAAAEDSAKCSDGHNREYTIVQVVANSETPSLKRKWKQS